MSEWIGAQPVLGMRNMNMESLFEYGSRAGFWRLHRAFTSRKVPVTVYGIAMATNPNPIVLSEGAHKYREQVDELVAAFETFPGPGPLRKEKNARPVSWTVFATRGRLSKNRCIRRR